MSHIVFPAKENPFNKQWLDYQGKKKRKWCFSCLMKKQNNLGDDQQNALDGRNYTPLMGAIIAVIMAVKI